MQYEFLTNGFTTKYGLPSDADAQAVLTKIENEVTDAIFSESDHPKWQEMIKDYREIKSLIGDNNLKSVANF